MNLPYMTAATGKNRKQIIAFAGLNYGQGAGDGELAESWGLSSARFPCLSQRDGRKTAGTYTSPTGLYARGKLCVVDGTDFLYDGKVVGQGTHQQLMDSCQVYQEIYYSQFPKEAV